MKIQYLFRSGFCSRSVRVFAAVLVCISLMSVLSACKSGEAEDEGTYVVRSRENDDGSRVISAGGADVAISGILRSLPENMPDIIPVPEHAAVESVQTISPEGSGTTLYMLELSTEENFESAAKWYGDALVSAGWSLEDQKQSGTDTYQMMLYSAGRSNGGISVQLSGENDRTYISIEAAVRMD